MPARKLFWFFILLLSVPFGSGAENELVQTNLIQNGDFSTALEGWIVSNANNGCVIQVDPQTKHGDMNSVILRREKPDITTAGYLESSPFPVKGGAVYLLECAVKGNGVPVTTTVLSPLAVSFYSAPDLKATYDLKRHGQYYGGAYVSSSGPGPGASFPVGTFDWQSYCFYARAFDETDTAVLRFSAPASGVLWIGNVRVTRVPLLRDVKYEIKGAFPVPKSDYAAPDGYLTDGIFGQNQSPESRDGKKICRSYTGLNQGITVTLALPRPTMVDRLVLSLVRLNIGHKLRKIEVLCDKLGQRVKASEGPGYVTDEYCQRVWLIEVPVYQNTGAIELRLFGEGHLVPYEVLVVEGNEKLSGESMKKHMLAGWMMLAAATAQDFGELSRAAAQEPVVLENECVRMEFCPAEGGVCKRVLYKRANKELVYSYSGAGYGLFRDRFWAPTMRDYTDVVYQHEVTKTPDSVAIHLWGLGSGGIYNYTEVHKTITLTKGSPLIRAEYEIKNKEESFSDGDYGFWIHNFLGVIGGQNRYFIPTTEGIREVLNDPKEELKKKESWIKNPAQGWMAGIGESGHGIAWGVDYKYLNLFYQYLSLAVPTCEWQYNQISVPCGKSLKTEVILMPFTGLERVDGFFKGIAGAVILPEKVLPGDKISPVAQLVSAGDRKLTLKFRSRLLPEPGWKDTGTREVELKNAVMQSVAWPKELALSSGTTVINCEISEDGKLLGALERPLTVGAASGKYELAPECAQVGSKQPADGAAEAGQLPEYKLTLEVVSPHVPWARPYARGPLKAVILTDFYYQREIVELMERFDLQVDSEHLWFDTTLGAPGKMLARLKRLRDKLQAPLDVIMIAGLHWEKTFDDETRKAILEKVKAGTGLVLVAPVGVSADLREALPFASGEKKAGYGFLEPKQKHFLTAGVPCDLIPQIRSIAYTGGIPAEKVLLAQNDTAAKKEIPILTTGALGKGRVACFLWDVYSHHLTGVGRGFSRITPLMVGESDPKTLKPAMTTRGKKEITWQCQEYIFSYLGRSLLWAANREPDLAVEITGRDEKGATAVMVESPEEKKATLELTYRNRFSEEEKRDLQTVELAKGKNSFSFTPPADLMPGITLTDLRVLAPDGKVMAWASDYYETKPSLEIVNVELEKPIVPAGDDRVIRGRVCLTGAAGADHAIEVLVTDFYDRLVFQGGFKATGTNTAFEARPLDALSIPMTVEVRLKKDKQILDKQARSVLFLKQRAWDSKECCEYDWYTSPFRGRPLSYLIEFGKRRVALMGVTSVMDSPYYTFLDPEVNAYPSPNCFWDINDHKQTEKINEYAKTKDRKCLVREPCFRDPEYREKTKDTMHNVASNAVTYGGGYSYCLGDEMSICGETGYYDFDFAPASVAAYREWLKNRYKTIGALNKEWETTYKDWAEIEPVTLDEARKRDNENYAPWSDFRTFMDDSLANFFAWCQKCLEEVDPQAKLSISGTGPATAGAGMDWWKICNSLKILHGYLRGLDEYDHQSLSRATGALYAPYLNNACGWLSGPLAEGTMWWGVFYEIFGLTSLGMSDYFNPDLTFSKTGLETKNFLAEARAGIWPLLRSVRRDPAPIAILYSQPSIQANCVMGRERRYTAAREAWINLLHDLSLQFDSVAYAQLEEKGFLAKRGYKVFILPEALALSDKEAAVLKEFASSGGVVIADNSAGWMNEHCRTLKTGQLDELFGLSADRQPAPAGKPKLVFKENWGDFKPGDSVGAFTPVGKVTPAKAAPVLSADDAVAGAIYRNAYGKGQAVYLNLSLVPYEEERQVGGRGETAYRQLISGALALAGIRPEFEVTTAAKKGFHGHVVSFTDNSVRYLGIIREYAKGEAEEAYMIRLPGKFHAYDVRAKKYLGQTDSINALLYAGAARLYALMPQEMKAPVLTCPETAARGSKVVGGIELAEPAGTHRVVKLEVYDPSGVLRTCYSGPQMIKPSDTKTAFGFNLALNDPSGEWTIKAVELASGKTVERKLEVKK